MKVSRNLADPILARMENMLNEKYSDLYVAQPKNYLSSQVHLVTSPFDKRAYCGRKIGNEWTVEDTIGEFCLSIDITCLVCLNRLDLTPPELDQIAPYYRYGGR